ncbi:MAG: hypothetical protein JO071_10985 [Deltaproteobacteria bacterium]|nr:hypothetical protein [Deltaproteobacteria bacterium]
MTAVCGQINPIAEGTKVPRDDDLLSQIILMLCHGENAVKMVVGLRRNGAGVIKENAGGLEGAGGCNAASDRQHLA